jgi:hypothetical protein
MQFVVSKEEERALQGKDTVFYYGGTEITYKRIQNFKSRRSKAVASPPNRGKLLRSPLLIHF